LSPTSKWKQSVNRINKSASKDMMAMMMQFSVCCEHLISCQTKRKAYWDDERACCLLLKRWSACCASDPLYITDDAMHDGSCLVSACLWWVMSDDGNNLIAGDDTWNERW
jgi:hypothetical protein